MEKTIQSVKQFMSVAGQEVKLVPCAPAKGIMELRLRLEFEELMEKAEGMGLLATFEDVIHTISDKIEARIFEEGATEHLRRDAPPRIKSHRFRDTEVVDLSKVYDAILDQRVVADGTTLAFGMQGVFSEGFDRVHANNMTKFPTVRQIAERTVEVLANKGQQAIIEEVTYEGTVYYVIKDAVTKKVLKPHTFESVELDNLLEAAIWAASTTEQQTN